MKQFNLANAEWDEQPESLSTVAFNESDLKSKNTNLSVIRIKPGQKLRPHFHKIRTEVVWVIKGIAIFTMAEQSITCRPGDLLLCEVGDVHTVENATKDEVTLGLLRLNDPGTSDMYWVEGEKT